MKANELWHGQEVAVYSRHLGIYDRYDLPRRAIVTNIGVPSKDVNRKNLLNEVKLIPQIGPRPVSLLDLTVQQVDGRSVKGPWSDWKEKVEKRYDDADLEKAKTEIRQKHQQREAERKLVVLHRVRGLLQGLGIEQTVDTTRYVIVRETRDLEKLEKILSAAMLRSSTEKLRSLNEKEEDEEIR